VQIRQVRSCAGFDTRQILLQHHRQFVGAPAMRVVLLSGTPMRKLEAMLRRHFAQLPDSFRPPPDYSRVECPFEGEALTRPVPCALRLSACASGNA
jgi:hypothetical protein